MAEEEIRDPGTVTFNDVAVYFSMREWELLADWQRKLYRNVMKEIHGALTALGYEIANPGILVRIQQSDEPYNGSRDASDISEFTWTPHSQKSEEAMADCVEPELPPVRPDILLRVKLENSTNEQSCQTSVPPDVEEESSSAVFNPELALWIKQEDGVTPGEPSSSLKEDGVPPAVEDFSVSQTQLEMFCCSTILLLVLIMLPFGGHGAVASDVEDLDIHCKRTGGFCEKPALPQCGRGAPAATGCAVGWCWVSR
ncbi:zinc finger protein 398-like isoform X3 [Eleutherodactylus coqui]|uniref:zinc finger protein 398-like isoform X3 n=1 Tax=Eleutherodactylus coqui TaxID=57060 RepID=UPI0034620D44